MKNITIFVTLGPSSLNRNFLKNLNKNKRRVSLVRLNMSHVKLESLRKKILKIQKFTRIPICIDTEGAQIRIKTKFKSRKFKLNQQIIINKRGGNFNVYPEEVFNKLKKGDILDIGFENLKLKVIFKTKIKILLKCLTNGVLENNKGVHLSNRKISLPFLTFKDYEAIKISKKLKIKNFALSFTNTEKDLERFSKILPEEKKYFKIETKIALKNVEKFFKKEKNFLIDRGDLSKDIKIENVPHIQRTIFKIANKNRKIKVAVATNFLESMIEKPYPTRAEVNDIYNSIEMGASSLVLAGETAMGKYPLECVNLIIKIIKNYEKNKKNKNK